VVGDTETCEWINLMLSRFWVFFEPVLCDMVSKVGEPVRYLDRSSCIQHQVIRRVSLATSGHNAA
jgi:hypothetical protein